MIGQCKMMKLQKLLLLFAFAILFGGHSSVNGLSRLIPRLYMESCSDGFGACMSTMECALQKGRSVGTCSTGTCCRVERTCNSVITANNSFFVSPDSIRTDSSCSVDVEKRWTIGGVCQMRLDLMEFETAPAGAISGSCNQDSLTVDGADESVPVICGKNDRQHLYVNVRNARRLRLTVHIGSSMRDRRWKIKITQIPCYSERLAPPGCLQYFEEPEGHVKSFGYDSTHNDSTYPLSQSYYMCFRDHCRLALSQVGLFALGQAADSNPGNDIRDGIKMNFDCADAKEDDLTKSMKPYIQIDDIRFCGHKFMRRYETRNPILAMHFVSPLREDYRTESEVHRGFNLHYRQLCDRGNKRLE